MKRSKTYEKISEKLLKRNIFFVLVFIIAAAASGFNKTIVNASYPTIWYCAHVQDIGWMDTVTNGTTAGATGRSLRMEAIQIVLEAKETGSVYDEKVNSFISDPRWKDGAPYGALASPVYSFTSPSKIKSGDVIKVTGSQHWIVVLYRNEEKLTTAEGNWTNGRYALAMMPIL